MRKIFTAVLIFITAQVYAQTKSLSGTWKGTLNAGRELIVLFQLYKANDTTYNGLLVVPVQSNSGIIVSKVSVKGDSVTAYITQPRITFKSVRLNDSTLAGEWQQGGAALPLTIVRSGSDVVKRTQTPRPPFTYNNQDVEYDNADKTVHFGGTFTWPKTGGRFPTLLLITGSGQQDRDETIFEHKPFAVLADYLTKRGYAVLRVDDRGIGKTTGTVTDATSADFAKDVQAGLAFLQTRSEVDKTKLGLLGHSEGGVIAPMVAAANPAVSFIVLWGAPVAGGVITNTQQNAYNLQKAGLSQAAVNAFSALHTNELLLFAKAADITALHAQIKPVYDAWKQQQPAAILNALHAGDSVIVGQSIYGVYAMLYNNPWMRFFIAHDFMADLANIHCKVLAINGTLDRQVDATTNLATIDSILQSKHVVHTIVPLKGLNHLLQTAETGDLSEYGIIQQTIAPAALQTIGDWLDENVKGKK